MAAPLLARMLTQRRVREAVSGALAGGCVEDLDGNVLAGVPAVGARHPITVSGTTLGWVVSREGGAAYAHLLGLLAASEAEKKELAREGVQKYKELALLYHVAEKIGSCLTIQDTAILVRDEVVRTIKRGQAHVLLHDANGAFYEPLGELPGALPAPLRDFLHDLMEDGRSEIVNCVQEDGRLAGEDLGAQSLMAASLNTNAGTLGVLLVLSEAPAEYRSEELRLLSALATLCASSVERARLHENITQETRLRSNFQRYLSPSVVEDIMANRTELVLGGKQADCSVLFSDLCGFTSLTEEKSAEEIIGFLNEYFTVMSAVIFRLGGTLDKFIGDAIMAVFGAPCEMEDPHGAAVQAAVEMHQALARLHWKWKQSGWPLVRHRIGINTGPVIAGNIGSHERMDYTVVGDAVNLAARLEALSPPMETTVSQETRDLVQPRLRAIPQAPVHVKGKARAVTPHRVVAIESHVEPDRWHFAIPATCAQEGAGAGQVLLVELRGCELTVESPGEFLSGSPVGLYPCAERDASPCPALQATLASQERREDAAGNSYFRARFHLPEQDLSDVLACLAFPAGAKAMTLNT